MKISKFIAVALVAVLAVAFLVGCSDETTTPTAPGTQDTITILSGTIVDNMTLSADKAYLLRGGVFVGRKDDPNKSTTLTIPAGTTIYGESTTDGMLVISRGGKIDAQGTASKPIVFTSDRKPGERARGDWGGVIINGWAPLNTGAEAEGEGGTGPYGGTNAADNSGILKYVRVEFAGREISPDNELNGIAFQGVGSATVVDYIQVHMNKDDGVEFFGGTVNAKHVYISGVADDLFDWTDGWTGKGQFWVGHQFPDDCDNGFEADNSAEDNEAHPRSKPTVYNITLVGAKDANGKSDDGMLLREGTAGVFKNVIITNFGETAVDIDHSATFNNAWNSTNSSLNGNLVLDNAIIWQNTTEYNSDADEAGFPFTTMAFVQTLNANNRFVDPGLVDPVNTTSPNYLPTTGSAATSGYASVPVDGWFDTANYVGAFAPGQNWLAGWTTHARN